MKILLKNAKIITFKDKDVINGDILIEGNRIKKIAKNIKVKADKIIDCDGNILMPGIKNAHTHSGMTFLRSYADDLSLENWLYNSVFPLEAHLTSDDVYHLTKLAFTECLTSGVTACFDMYFFPRAIQKASLDIGMRTLILGIPHEDRGDAPEIGNMLDESKDKNLLSRFALGFHAVYTSKDKQLKEIARLSKQYKAPVYMHCSETKVEVDNCLKEHKMTPTMYFNKYHLFDYGGGIYHGVHLNDKDIALLKRKKVYVATCPCSNLKLASGIAPIKKMYQKGIKIAIGTDGPASNNGLDMFREIYLTSVLSKYRENDPASIDAYEILKMACVNGAHMMQMDDADSLAVNKFADIVMIDIHKPDMQPINNIIKNIVYSGNKLDVKMTMIDGKILYYDNKFYLKDKIEDIYKNAAMSTARLKKYKNKK